MVIIYVFSLFCIKTTSHLRLGPSASQMVPPSDVINGLVQAVTLLKNVMKEPWAHQLLGIPPIDAAKLKVPTPEPPALATPPAVAAPAVEAKVAAPAMSLPPPKKDVVPVTTPAGDGEKSPLAPGDGSEKNSFSPERNSERRCQFIYAQGCPCQTL